jgi:hypothetical protein
VWDDPCDAVESLPEDPTGEDCYRCKDPATGEDWGGYCNVHSCTTDEECVSTMGGDVCVEGKCQWSEWPDDGGGGGGTGGSGDGSGMGRAPSAP